MPLTLRAVSLNDQPITQPIVATFGPQGGSLGRADTNTLALPDPERRISRRQADISVVGAGFVIKNVGSANPIIVRDQSLALGESAPLRDGDQVRIGGYLLAVTSEAGSADDRTNIDGVAAPVDPFAAIEAPVAAAAKPGVRPPAYPPSSPFADLGAPVSAGNPFAELLGEPARAAPPFAAPAPSAAPNRLPDDFDPFAPAAPAPAAPPRPSTSHAGSAFEDLIPSAAPASIDAMFGLAPGGGSSDPLADFLAGAPVAPTGARAGDPGALSTDPLALFAGDKDVPRPRPVREDSPDQTPELRGAFVPPQPLRPPPARQPAATTQESPSWSQQPAGAVRGSPGPCGAGATDGAGRRATRTPGRCPVGARCRRRNHRPPRHRLAPRRPRRLERPLRRRRRPARPAAQHRAGLHARRRHDAALLR